MFLFLGFSGAVFVVPNLNEDLLKHLALLICALANQSAGQPPNLSGSGV